MRCRALLGNSVVTRDRLKTAASVLIFLSLALSGAPPVELKMEDYIQHVPVAVDLYGESAMPVERAAQLACAAGARLQILYVASSRVQQSNCPVTRGGRRRSQLVWRSRGG